jgi:hypothetical protein
MRSGKRSPSYPRISLDRAVAMAKNIYDSAYEAPVDTDTALQLMGYSGRSGPSTAALSSLKQYGLVEGRDQALRITPLALRIFHPSTPSERFEALNQAVFAPAFYSEIKSQFGGKLPSDQVLKSYLIRTHSFNPSGADFLAKILRENRTYMEQAGSAPTPPSPDLEDPDPEQTSVPSLRSEAFVPRIDPSTLRILHSEPSSRELERREQESAEVLQFRISPECIVRISFIGKVSRSAIEKTVQYLDIAKDQYD